MTVLRLLTGLLLAGAAWAVAFGVLGEGEVSSILGSIVGASSFFLIMARQDHADAKRIEVARRAQEPTRWSQLVAEYMGRDPWDPTSTIRFLVDGEEIPALDAFKPPSRMPVYGYGQVDLGNGMSYVGPLSQPSARQPRELDYRPGGMRPAILTGGATFTPLDREAADRERIYRETHWVPDGRSADEVDLKREIRAQRAIPVPLPVSRSVGLKENEGGIPVRRVRD